ncbi:MAG: prepilin-type N-terminal cleavage/methylation domain-containing protein [Puniceicoccales bacterium]|jgi:hypothetical protein|nr:prepilin-type N-terminal cleavage/methylation domain-containing protein [Puniceicoccales bacterium]
MVHSFQRGRRIPAFTLVELLAVLAIIGLMVGVIVTVRPDNPEGIDAARRVATSVFGAARLRAEQSPNPDRQTEKRPLYNVRSRVLVLNDPTRPEQHLRLLRIIVGGTRKPDSTEAANYVWYTMDADTTLPEGVYMISPFDTSFKNELLKSRITPRENTGSVMTLNFEPSLDEQQEGTGDKSWFFYEFNNDGTSNMWAATFMISEGTWDPADKRVIFRNEQNVTGFWIQPSGVSVPYSDPDELKSSNL